MTATTTPQHWRNSRFLVGLFFFSAVLTFALGLLIVLIAIGLEIPFTFGALFKSAFTLFAGLAVLRGAMWQWGLARVTARNEVRFEPDAAYIVRVGAEPDQAKVRVAWADIARVRRSGDAVTIRKTDGSEISFNAYEFFLPSHLGKAIAARAGKEFK